MTRPLATAVEIRRHVELKRSAHELRDEVADRLLVILDDAGSEPDYASLLWQATFPDPPTIVWHTAPSSARCLIERDGLQPSSPGTSSHWRPTVGTPCANGFLDDQPRAVYVGANPDWIGLWSHWSSWDIWEVALGDLPWRHDEINPGCWAITARIPPQQLLSVVGSESP